MKLLLDTHALIWFGENDPRLSKKVVLAIESTENVKYVSIASLWEMAIKCSLGKLQLNQPLEDIVESLQSNGFELLSVTPNHVLQIENLPFFHKDPFDRMLIAQANIDDLTVISNEGLFDQYSVRRLW